MLERARGSSLVRRETHREKDGHLAWRAASRWLLLPGRNNVREGSDYRRLILEGNSQKRKIPRTFQTSWDNMLQPGESSQVLGDQLEQMCSCCSSLPAAAHQEQYGVFIYLFTYWQIPSSINNEDGEQLWPALHASLHSCSSKTLMKEPGFHVLIYWFRISWGEHRERQVRGRVVTQNTVNHITCSIRMSLKCEWELIKNTRKERNGVRFFVGGQVVGVRLKLPTLTDAQFYKTCWRSCLGAQLQSLFLFFFNDH